jgi:hypothetical protein
VVSCVAPGMNSKFRMPAISRWCGALAYVAALR